jgi:ribose transport system permease protein
VAPDVSARTSQQGAISALGARLRGTRTRHDLASFGVPAFAVAMFAVFSLLEPATFPTTGNVDSIVTSQAVPLILALAVTLVLRCGDFDLSVSATMALSAVTSGTLAVQNGISTPTAILIALGIGLTVGTVNGLLVVVVGLNGFIATLGTMTAIQGLCFAVTGSQVITSIPNSLTGISATSIGGGIPLGALYGWILVLILWFVAEYLPFGRDQLFIGGNIEAAHLAGVRVRRVRFISYLLAGLLSGFAGIVLLGNIGSADPSVAPQFLLAPYAAAFLGSTCIQIGRFNVIGTLVGAYLVSIGIAGLELLGVESWIADVLNGAALVAAVTFARLRRGGG